MITVCRSYLLSVFLIFLFLEPFRIYWSYCRKANKTCLIFYFREILKSLTLLILQSLTVLWGHSGEAVSWCRSIALISWIVISDLTSVTMSFNVYLTNFSSRLSWQISKTVNLWFTSYIGSLNNRGVRLFLYLQIKCVSYKQSSWFLMLSFSFPEILGSHICGNLGDYCN